MLSNILKIINDAKNNKKYFCYKFNFFDRFESILKRGAKSRKIKQNSQKMANTLKLKTLFVNLLYKICIPLIFL